MSQSRVAATLGISRQLYNSMRWGRTDPSWWFLAHVIRTFDLDPKEAIDLIEKSYPRADTDARIAKYTESKWRLH